MAEDLLFATFFLDDQHDFEIGINVQYVREATRLNQKILPLPSSVDWVEGIMTLRGEVIPIINLKKRLHFKKTDYGPDSRIAIVEPRNKPYGLLVNNIHDVFRIQKDKVDAIEKRIQSDDKVIKGVIKLDGGSRLVEILDIAFIFEPIVGEDAPEEARAASTKKKKRTKRRRFIVFKERDQEYGLPINDIRAIQQASDLSVHFRDEADVAGSISFRGQTIPVIDFSTIGRAGGPPTEITDDARVIILRMDDATFGILVSSVTKIVTADEDQILSMPSLPEEEKKSVTGVLQPDGDHDILLLNTESVFGSRREELRSVTILEGAMDVEIQERETGGAGHLITENSYLLVETGGKNFAVQLTDVREIIKGQRIMQVPGKTDYLTGIINLRGLVLPVIDLRIFFSGQEARGAGADSKLVVVGSESKAAALLVDEIVTILKEVRVYNTPRYVDSDPVLAKRHDSMDHFIDVKNEDGTQDNILVINVCNIISHLDPGELKLEEA